LERRAVMIVLTNYRGGLKEVDEGITELLNAARGEVEAWAFRRVRREDVEALYRYSWYDPTDFGVALVGGKAPLVVGTAWAYPAPNPRGRHTIAPTIAPNTGLGREGLEKLLAWGRWRLEALGGARGRVTIRSWLEGSTTHRLVREVLGGAGVEEHELTLMRWGGRSGRAEALEGYVIREGDVGGDDLVEAVRIYNKVFAEELGFVRWGVEDARRFYRREGLSLMVAEEVGGGVVGFVDGRVFRAVDGGLSAEVMTVAVLKEHRGRGLGKALVSAMVGKLASAGVPECRVALVSLAGLEPLYRRLGFEEVRRFVRFEAPITSLPAPASLGFVRRGTL